MEFQKVILFRAYSDELLIRRWNKWINENAWGQLGND